MPCEECGGQLVKTHCNITCSQCGLEVGAILITYNVPYFERDKKGHNIIPQPLSFTTVGAIKERKSRSMKRMNRQQVFATQKKRVQMSQLRDFKHRFRLTWQEYHELIYQYRKWKKKGIESQGTYKAIAIMLYQILYERMELKPLLKIMAEMGHKTDPKTIIRFCMRHQIKLPRRNWLQYYKGKALQHYPDLKGHKLPKISKEYWHTNGHQCFYMSDKLLAACKIGILLNHKKNMRLGKLAQFLNVSIATFADSAGPYLKNYRGKRTYAENIWS